MDQSFPFTVAELSSFGTASVPQWDEPNRDWPLVAQLEPVLGEEFAPDAEFFVESWTYGVAAATANLRLRGQMRKDRAQRESSWQDFGFFMPRFSAEEFLAEHQRARDARIPSSPCTATLDSTLKETEESAQDCERDYVTGDSLTMQQARCLLGVDMSSSRSQIKTAYRRLVRMNHPDRLVGASERAKQVATEKTIFINMAYRLLCSSLLAEPA